MTADFTNETLDPVTHHRISHLAAYGDADAIRAIRSPCVDEKKVRLMHLVSIMGKTKEVGPFPESQRGRKAETGRHQLLGGNLNRQTLAPLGATALDDKTTIFRGHPDKKTMGSFSTDITGLKGSFHGYLHLLRNIYSVPCETLVLTIFLAKCQEQIYGRG